MDRMNRAWKYVTDNMGVLLGLSVVILAIFYCARMVPSPDPQPVFSVNFTQGILAADDARLSNLENHLEDCNVQLKKKNDPASISFFQEASAASHDDTRNAMNRYLYFAIMHAVVLRRPFDGTDQAGQKVGRFEVETYLHVMLDTMKHEEITSKDAQAEFKEMNRYLYLTIVQAGVLQTKYQDIDPPNPNPLPLPPPPPPPVDPIPTPPPTPDVPTYDELKSALDGLKLKLEIEGSQVNTLKGKLDKAEKLEAKLNDEINDLKTRNTKLTNDLATCTEDANNCTSKLKGCHCQADKVPQAPISEPHPGLGDDEDY